MPPYEIVSYLGSGGEGVVYLLADQSNRDHVVLKVFFEPRKGLGAEGLQLYATEAPPSDLGLPSIRLVSDSGSVLGYWYPYVKLNHVHSRILYHFDSVSQALLTDYLAMQSYLIGSRELVLHDAVNSQFMLSRQGKFHFVDLGWAISTLDAPYVIRSGLVGHSLLSLLCSIYGLRWDRQRENNYSYREPCVYFRKFPLDDLLRQKPWLRDLIHFVRSNPASVFLEFEFYDHWARRFDDRVPFPRFVVTCSQILRFAYAKVRGISYVLPEPPKPPNIGTILEQVSMVRCAEQGLA